MKLLINFSTTISAKVITILWRGKHGTVMIHSIHSIHSIRLIQSFCSVGKSEDSLVKFRRGNIIRCNPWKRKIDDQLKNIREEKHKEFFYAGHKSLSWENNKNKENQKQGDNLQDRNAGKNEPKETNSRSHLAVAGDSMVNGIDEKWLSQKHGLVMLKFFTFQVQ